MVQPTRIVCCARVALTLTKTAATTPAVKTHLEGIRIMPPPLARRQQAQPKITCAKPFMVQTIRQAIGTPGYGGFPARPGYVVERVLNRCGRSGGEGKRDKRTCGVRHSVRPAAPRVAVLDAG